MTDGEKREYEKWASLLTSEALSREYTVVKKMASSEASRYMVETCEAERKYRDKIIGKEQ